MEKAGKSEFQVSKILDKKVRKGKNVYLIKWKGYKSSQNSWQPQENLISCAQLVESFNKTIGPKQKNIKKRNKSGLSQIKKVQPKIQKEVGKQEPAKISIDGDEVSKNTRLAFNAIKEPAIKLKEPARKSFCEPTKQSESSSTQIITQIYPIKINISEVEDASLIKDATLKVDKMLKDKWGKLIYEVTSKGKKETVSWDSLIERNFMALIEFYQSKIRLMK